VDNEQIQVLEVEFFELSAKFDRFATQFFAGKIDVATFERSLISNLKEATIRAYIVGANGTATAKHFGSSGLHLRQKYADVHRLVTKISNGELSEAQIRDRLRRQARSIQTAASRSEKITQVLDGFDLAHRSLDPQANHCPSCLTHATEGFVPVAEVVPRGINCECGGYCRCRITYKKSGNPLNPLTLADTVIEEDKKKSMEKDELLEKIEQLLKAKRRGRSPTKKGDKLGFGTN
jgi:hypothetical protein